MLLTHRLWNAKFEDCPYGSEGLVERALLKAHLLAVGRVDRKNQTVMCNIGSSVEVYEIIVG